ncbi:MAG: MarR family transcriptional regulator [Acidimicrobiia bacterium]|nr:MarR family transcriptional regulator [Acidimicrobiia bacterium]
MKTATTDATPGRAEPGLMAAVMRLQLLVSAQLGAITEGHGIALADYLVLGVIRRSANGVASPSAICEVLHRTSGGMTLTLDRLEGAGWLARSPDPHDRRKVSIALTGRGRRLAVAVNDDLHKWEHALDLGSTRLRHIVTVVDEIADVLERPARP